MRELAFFEAIPQLFQQRTNFIFNFGFYHFHFFHFIEANTLAVIILMRRAVLAEFFVIKVNA